MIARVISDADLTTLPARYVLTGGSVYSPADPFATSMMVVDSTIVWVGSDAGALVHEDSVDAVIDLKGALVTPAFVDAHVHTTATGLGLIGLDLTGTRSSRDLIQAVRDHCRNLPVSAVVWGHGWDDSHWPDSPPTRQEIDDAGGGRIIYLSRVDVHSALISTSLVSRCMDLDNRPGFDAIGPIRMDAHLRARETAFDALDDVTRRAAQSAALSVAARQGIASVHEMAGPGISSAADLRSVLTLGLDPTQPEVVGYWGALHGVDEARDLGAIGCAGDLFVDGSLGSHTACVRVPYSDAPDNTGVAYLSADDIATHIIECTQAGIQGGFHVIGDGAMDLVCDGLTQVRDRLGSLALRQAAHRLEHAEMLDPAHIELLADLHITASVQPAFDAAWGGSDGMYARRLGAARAATLNPFAAASSAGVPLAFGSDAPVTALAPWESVRAAAFHRTPQHRISTRAAFLAHTRGGRRAAKQQASQPGVLREDTPATFAVWAPSGLVVAAPDSRVAAWSTDPRSGTPGLPDLESDSPSPECWLTVRDGTVIHSQDPVLTTAK